MGTVENLVPHEPGMPVEAIVTVNGHRLSIAESMTLRVALESFAMSLSEEGMGDDEHGRTMLDGYMSSIGRIRQKSYNYTDTHHGERIPW